MVLFHHCKTILKDSLMKLDVPLSRSLFKTIYGSFKLANFALLFFSLES